MELRSVNHVYHRIILLAYLSNQCLVLKAGDPTEGTVTTGRGKKLAFEKGDALITSYSPSVYGVTRPYQWMYAVDENHVMLFQPTLRRIFCPIRPVLVNVRERFKNVLMMNLGKLPGYVGAPGITLAAIILDDVNQTKLHYNPFYCNSRHYVEYLSTGKVTGTWPSRVSMDRDCPLTAPLVPEMGVYLYYKAAYKLKAQRGPEIPLKVKGPYWPNWAVGLDYAQPKPPYDYV